MRLAFVDLEFSWPPPGGAQIHLLHDMTELRRLGHEVRLIAPLAEGSWRFGRIEEEALPVPVTPILLASRPFPRDELVRKVRAAVDAFAPDVVMLAFGFYLKAHLAAALSDYPLISRYYTYEMICVRDFLLYRDEHACPNSFLDTPNRCRRCFVRFWGPGFPQEGTSGFADEFLANGGLHPAFHRLWVEHLRNLDALVVTNEMTRQRLEKYNDNIHVVPGGVSIERFPYRPPPEREPGDKKIIFMSGRADDQMKGFHTLRRAGEVLSEKRDDFEIWVTLAKPPNARPFIRYLGWREQDELRRLYGEADICVVPSVWEEPFGLVAVEAMASGRPVCASRVGGLQSIVVDGETGFLFTGDNRFELAHCLGLMLDHAALRRDMGMAGRRRAETVYDWPRVVERHYPALLESVLP